MSLSYLILFNKKRKSIFTFCNLSSSLRIQCKSIILHAVAYIQVLRDEAKIVKLLSVMFLIAKVINHNLKGKKACYGDL